MAQPLTPEQLYVQSGLTASSGVDAALLTADAGANTVTNAITEQLQNLDLPAYESTFLPASYWDTAAVGTGMPDGYAGITTAQDDTVSAATNVLTGFSLFGLPAAESWLIAGGVLWLLLRKRSHGGRR